MHSDAFRHNTLRQFERLQPRLLPKLVLLHFIKFNAILNV